MVTQNPNFTIAAITSTMYRSNNLHDNRLRSRNTSASYSKPEKLLEHRESITAPHVRVLLLIRTSQDQLVVPYHSLFQ
jgi:hypothetical protein